MAKNPTVTVRSFRVGQVKVRPDNIAGTGKPMLWWTFTSRTWTEWLPVWVFVIDHPKGVVLFDTGQDPASVAVPGYYPGGFLGVVYRRQAAFRFDAGESLAAALAGGGVDRASISTVVISHLHQDHAGNVADFVGTRIVVSAAERALLDEKAPEMHGVLASHLGGVEFEGVEFTPLADATLLPFTEGHDLHGDGSLILLPTPGHSVGSMSLLVRRADAPPLLLVGDVTYDPTLLAQGIVPGTGAEALQKQTAERINALRERMPDLLVLAAHDPSVAAHY